MVSCASLHMNWNTKKIIHINQSGNNNNGLKEPANKIKRFIEKITRLLTKLGVSSIKWIALALAPLLFCFNFNLKY